MSKKSQYLADVIRLLNPEQIKLSAEHPSQFMTKSQVLLHYVALRRLGYF